MGKKQHQKDKLYLTTVEWRTEFGGFKGERKKQFTKLPFDHCCLSLQPFEIPVCTLDGHLFDFLHIVPFLKKYGKNPVTGEKLDPKSLIRLNFHKNSEGKYGCPVTYKTFTDTTKIAAIATSGNVFAYEAVQELNIKQKCWKDLLTNEAFTKKDIIVLQDPQDIQKSNVASFHHVKLNLKILDEDEAASTSNLRKPNTETKHTLSKLKDSRYEIPDYMLKNKKSNESAETLDVLSTAHYSASQVSSGFTSTVMEPLTKHEPARIDEDFLRYQRVKKKGYVQINTNLGPLNVELHCDITQKTCENFLKLCQKGYYDETVFHRSIKHFMLQGGDPEGKGTGGQSYWGEPFKDEFKSRLTHSGRGVLSMANSGPNTNRSQLVVGGLATLDAIERVETDNKDRPIEKIKIINTVVYVDPYAEADEKLATEREALRLESEKGEPKDNPEEAEVNGVVCKVDGAPEPKVFRKGVAKYLNSRVVDKSAASDLAPKKKKARVSLNDFSSW